MADKVTASVAAPVPDAPAAPAAKTAKNKKKRMRKKIQKAKGGKRGAAPPHAKAPGGDGDDASYVSGAGTDIEDSDFEGADGYKRGGYHPVFIGETYGGRYLVLRKLGWGHFSTVWLCEDLRVREDEARAQAAASPSRHYLRRPRYVAMKVQKSAEHYMDAAKDEIEILNTVTVRAVEANDELREEWVLLREQAAAAEATYVEPSIRPDMTDAERDAVEKEREMHTGRQLLLAETEPPMFDPHVVRLLDSFTHTGPHGTHMCMVFEMLGDNLLALIKAYKYKGIPLEFVRKITRQICIGLDFLHRRCGIIHTDLKPENVLLSAKLPPMPVPPEELEGSIETLVEMTPEEVAEEEEREKLLARKVGLRTTAPAGDAPRPAGSQTIAELEQAIATATGEERKKLKRKLKKKRGAAGGKAPVQPTAEDDAHAASQLNPLLLLTGNFFMPAHVSDMHAPAASGAPESLHVNHASASGFRLLTADGTPIAVEDAGGHAAVASPTASTRQLPTMEPVADGPGGVTASVLVCAARDLLAAGLLRLVNTFPQLHLRPAASGDADGWDVVSNARSDPAAPSTSASAPASAPAAASKSKKKRRRGKRGGAKAKAPAAAPDADDDDGEDDADAVEAAASASVREVVLAKLRAIPAAASSSVLDALRRRWLPPGIGLESAQALPARPALQAWQLFCAAHGESSFTLMRAIETVLPELAFVCVPTVRLSSAADALSSVSSVSSCQTFVDAPGTGTSLTLASSLVALQLAGDGAAPEWLAGIKTATHRVLQRPAAEAATTAADFVVEACPLLRQTVDCVPSAAATTTKKATSSEHAVLRTAPAFLSSPPAKCTVQLRPLEQRCALWGLAPAAAAALPQVFGDASPSAVRLTVEAVRKIARGMALAREPAGEADDGTKDEVDAAEEPASTRAVATPSAALDASPPVPLDAPAAVRALLQPPVLPERLMLHGKRAKKVRVPREMTPEEKEAARQRYVSDLEAWEAAVFDMDAVIVDLGNACWVDRHFSEEIQTRQYRAPEVILGAGYDTSADVWSLACQTFELITGDLLFDPALGDNYTREEDHLAQMMELCGPIPVDMALTGKFSADYFDDRGRLLHIHDLRFWGPASVLTDKYSLSEASAAMVESFMLHLMAFSPGERFTAQDALSHPWLMRNDDGSFIDFDAAPELVDTFLQLLPPPPSAAVTSRGRRRDIPADALDAELADDDEYAAADDEEADAYDVSLIDDIRRRLAALPPDVQLDENLLAQLGLDDPRILAALGLTVSQASPGREGGRLRTRDDDGVDDMEPGELDPDQLTPSTMERVRQAAGSRMNGSIPDFSSQGFSPRGSEHGRGIAGGGDFEHEYDDHGEHNHVDDDDAMIDEYMAATGLPPHARESVWAAMRGLSAQDGAIGADDIEAMLYRVMSRMHSAEDDLQRLRGIQSDVHIEHLDDDAADAAAISERAPGSAPESAEPPSRSRARVQAHESVYDAGEGGDDDAAEEDAADDAENVDAAGGASFMRGMLDTLGRLSVAWGSTAENVAAPANGTVPDAKLRVQRS